MQKLDSTTFDILQGWMRGKQPTPREQEALIARELLAETRSKAFGINRRNCQQSIEARSQLFRSAHKNVWQWSEQQRIQQDEYNSLSLLWTFWLPLAINLAETRQELGRTPIQGILGGQGTGKSTLTQVLSLLLKHLGYTTAVISLDDLYKTYADRQQLQETDPRLIWRGPPGTHDVDLGLKVLEQCLQKNNTDTILIPRFDKSAYQGIGERGDPEMITSADLVLFEGWFVGVRPLPDTIWSGDRSFHPAIITEDKDFLFAQDCNERLKDYIPLWDKLDRLLVLYPEDYQLSKQWRREAEQKMMAQERTGMSDLEIEEFVTYFWRSLHPELYIKPLISDSSLVDLVVEIKSDRSYGNIYKPG
jgi:D-glycerate 3-kinase